MLKFCLLWIAGKCIFLQLVLLNNQTSDQKNFSKEKQTLNPGNKNYLVKTIVLKLYYVIYDSTAIVITNLICLANTPAPDLVTHHLEKNLTATCVRPGSAGRTERKLPIECTTSAKVCAKESRKTKSACYCTYRWISGIQQLLNRSSCSDVSERCSQKFCKIHSGK